MKVNFKNRHGYECSITEIETGWWFRIDEPLDSHWNCSDTHIDPAGGPFISVDSYLSDYHSDLPEEKITSIKNEVIGVDASGYEYFGWVLHTSC
jgi:hypothetical protein